jgi:hypothetical protein
MQPTVDTYESFLGRDDAAEIRKAGERSEGCYVFEEVVWACADSGVVDVGCVDDQRFDEGAGDVADQGVVAASGVV